jgi:hypothetical protein
MRPSKVLTTFSLKNEAKIILPIDAENISKTLLKTKKKIKGSNQ